MPILGLTIRAVIALLMVPITSVLRSVPQNITPSMTSPSLACISVSHCQGNGQIDPKELQSSLTLGPCVLHDYSHCYFVGPTDPFRDHIAATFANHTRRRRAAFYRAPDFSRRK